MRAIWMGCVLFFSLTAGSAHAQEEAGMESIVLGGGCFWCLDAAYRLVPGVVEVITGYSGGHTENPDYKAVCTGETGHAEVVQVRFDPGEVTLDRLLDLFWKIHDPTTLNRQGADIGTQYRSVIFYANEAQGRIAKASLEDMRRFFNEPIVTQLAPLKVFYKAEEYHQNYFSRNPDTGYCVMVVAQKVRKAKEFLGQ